jgi:methionyl-tRNA formyltransferase
MADSRISCHHMGVTPDRIKRIILLTSPEETPPLGDILRAHNPDLEVVGVHDREAVSAACAAAEPGTRLISFCTSVIVPGAALAALPGPGYNFHPGPPNRPGRYPSIFAIYDGDPKFGITIHEMAPKVDSGAIVAIDHFDMPPGCDLAELERITYLCLASAFRRLAKPLAVNILPLPRIAQAWSGHKTTLVEAMALARVTPDMSEDEIALRRRACGQIMMPAEDPGWPT